MHSSTQKWMLVLPPEGAARQVGEKTWEALADLIPSERRKLFDTKPYLDGFDKLLKNPTDDMVVDLMNQALIVQCLDFSLTHLLVIALSPLTRFTVDLLRRSGICTLHWFIEDFRVVQYWKAVLPAYDHFFAIQRGPLPLACESTGTVFHYLPTAFILPPQAKVKSWEERNKVVAFIGFPSVYRIEVLELLHREKIPLKIAGAGWEKYRGPLEGRFEGTGWFGPEDAYKLLSHAKVGLHLPSEDPRKDRDNDHISPRVFDILAAGCLLLTEQAPLIDETLSGIAISSFQGPQQVVQKAREVMMEPYARNIQDQNRAVVLTQHTFKARLEKIQAAL